jgi:hypothetical protein
MTAKVKDKTKSTAKIKKPKPPRTAKRDGTTKTDAKRNVAISRINEHLERQNGGRPTSYNDEAAVFICTQIANGSSLKTALQTPGLEGLLPSMATWFRWLEDKNIPQLRELYETARKARAGLLVEEIIDIADDATNDYMDQKQADGSFIPVVDKEHIQRSRLRVDARKWTASKLLKEYSDSLVHKTEPGDPLNTLLSSISGGIKVASAVSDEDDK